MSSNGHTYYGGVGVDIDELKKFSMDDTSKYVPFSAYQQSKMGNIVLAKEFLKRYEGMEAVSLHPGAIATNLGRNLSLHSILTMIFTLVGRFFTGKLQVKTPEQGAATTITCAALPSSELQQGAYYADCEVKEEAEGATAENAKMVFDYCDEVTKAFQ